ncbi:type II toxin-antitoxin system RelE/ParE family toxin [uncultured Mucilaginibacter sp.]|uniref:type II toxin-antitoxin system RelE/ParE family toxin n=1 Tax=uncultured Mucilaginibacter sp. TaxID=797541 RepID=UPI00262D59FF|nr:type II toxin-antitoxin system RelE/ParE family toxin [uncultured Mucilaginibacter sp.]
MALTVNWSEEARFQFENIIDFLNYRWTEKETKDFILKTEAVVKVIRAHPYIYPASNYNQIRKAVITKQTSLFYLIRTKEIYLVSFWDNRQNPTRNPF